MTEMDRNPRLVWVTLGCMHTVPGTGYIVQIPARGGLMCPSRGCPRSFHEKFKVYESCTNTVTASYSTVTDDFCSISMILSTGSEHRFIRSELSSCMTVSQFSAKVKLIVFSVT